MRVRAEKEEDRAAIKAVNESAFETDTEANLVAALREQARRYIPRALVWAGLEECEKLGFAAVVVLGHPGRGGLLGVGLLFVGMGLVTSWALSGRTRAAVWRLRLQWG